MAKFENENRAEEERCLDEVANIIWQRRESKEDVAAIIIEPITAFENQMATPNFYRQLRKIALENEIPFIVDETKTGLGSTGKMWAHEYWNLGTCADIVTFGGKAGISGFYSTLPFRMTQDEFSFDQSVDMIKLLSFGITWKQIQKNDYLTLVGDTGMLIKTELLRVEKEKGIV